MTDLVELEGATRWFGTGHTEVRRPPPDRA